jgi:hypothetical protein
MPCGGCTAFSPGATSAGATLYKKRRAGVFVRFTANTGCPNHDLIAVSSSPQSGNIRSEFSKCAYRLCQVKF